MMRLELFNFVGLKASRRYHGGLARLRRAADAGNRSSARHRTSLTDDRRAGRGPEPAAAVDALLRRIASLRVAA